MWQRLSRLARGHRRVERQLERMETTQAQGLALLLSRLNQARQQGDVRGVERVSRELERFLQAAALSNELPERIDALFQDGPGRGQFRPREMSGEAPGPDDLQGGASPAPPEAAQGEALYWISSATLAEAFAYLTQRGPHNGGGEPEWMLAVTGLRVGAMRTLEHLVEIRMSSQSFSQAAFDMADFVRVAIQLYDQGMALHAIFHSHRFAGPPTPSSTDDHLQETLEQGGYPAIQAVFSEDGYVRFFARQRAFQVQVFGKGVEAIHGNKELYRIVHFGTLPHPSLATDRRSAPALRSLPAAARR